MLLWASIIQSIMHFMNYAGGWGAKSRPDTQRDCSVLFVNVFVHKMAPKTNI